MLNILLNRICIKACHLAVNGLCAVYSQFVQLRFFIFFTSVHNIFVDITVKKLDNSNISVQTIRSLFIFME